MINTVLGSVDDREIKATLSHEHICCYSEYIHKMTGNKSFDKDELVKVSVEVFKRFKDTYGINLFVDCTPVNLGRRG